LRTARPRPLEAPVRIIDGDDIVGSLKKEIIDGQSEIGDSI
jgi:hypothetical protein